MEKQGWEIRVESDNKNGTHARDLLWTRHCIFVLNSFLWWRKADGRTYLCIYLDLVNSISQHSLCYDLAAALEEPDKADDITLINTYEGQKYSYRQKKFKITQGSR